MSEGEWTMRRKLGQGRLRVATKVPGYFGSTDLRKFTREAIRDGRVKMYTADRQETSDLKQVASFAWHE